MLVLSSSRLPFSSSTCSSSSSSFFLILLFFIALFLFLHCYSSLSLLLHRLIYCLHSLSSSAPLNGVVVDHDDNDDNDDADDDYDDSDNDDAITIMVLK